MKKIILLLIPIALTSCVDTNSVRLMEKAYFEGQRDAMKGDWKIVQQSDSCYNWVKSPWKNGREPVYQPVICK